VNPSGELGNASGGRPGAGRAAEGRAAGAGGAKSRAAKGMSPQKGGALPEAGKAKTGGAAPKKKKRVAEGGGGGAGSEGLGKGVGQSRTSPAAGKRATGVVHPVASVTAGANGVSYRLLTDAALRPRDPSLISAAQRSVIHHEAAACYRGAVDLFTYDVDSRILRLLAGEAALFGAPGDGTGRAGPGTGAGTGAGAGAVAGAGAGADPDARTLARRRQALPASFIVTRPSSQPPGSSTRNLQSDGGVQASSSSSQTPLPQLTIVTLTPSLRPSQPQGKIPSVPSLLSLDLSAIEEGGEGSNKDGAAGAGAGAAVSSSSVPATSSTSTSTFTSMVPAPLPSPARGAVSRAVGFAYGLARLPSSPSLFPSILPPAEAPTSVSAKALADVPSLPADPLSSYTPASWKTDLLLRCIRRHAPAQLRFKTSVGTAILFGVINSSSRQAVAALSLLDPEDRKALAPPPATGEGEGEGTLSPGTDEGLGLQLRAPDTPPSTPITTPTPHATATPAPVPAPAPAPAPVSPDLRAAVALLASCWTLTGDPGLRDVLLFAAERVKASGGASSMHVWPLPARKVVWPPMDAGDLDA
jgi:hypothetical protein